jgi:hypothetical protein
MRSGTKVLIAAAILTRAFSIVPLESRADETAEPDAPQAFPSPSEVFDAYRQAQDKRDGQAAFSCLTSEFRDDEIYDAYLTCITYTTHLDPDSPKVAALLKKFGIESSLVDAEYGKRYKEKYDVDIAKLIAQRKKNLAKVAEDYFKQHAQLGQHAVIFQRAGVADRRLAGGNVFEQPAHDLAAARLGQRAGESHVVGLGQRADFFANMQLELLAERFARLAL